MRISTTVFVLAAALGLAAPGEAASPAVLRDIPYAPALGEYGLGDLWLPAKAQPDGAASEAGHPPVVLLIHGGGWSVGHRPSVAGIAQFFRDDLGFAVFNIEYRLASATNRWPACGNDCVAAANWLFTDDFRRLAGFSPDKIWLCGGSAGGHLALWTLVNLSPEKVAGCVSISSIGDPMPDFRAHRGRYTPLFGPVSDEATLAAMNPISLIRPGMAPLLCTHADTDAVVPIASHRAFADAYRAAGNRCDFFEYPHDAEPNKGGHFIWRTSHHRLLSIIEERISAFVRDGRRQPLFAADFDGTARAAISGGAPDPLPSSRNLDFVPGLRGQALHIPAGADAFLSYATHGNMNLHRGAASFWFKPDAGAPGSRFFLCTETASPRRGSGTLWFWQWDGKLRADQSDDADLYAISPRQLVPGAWNHIVFSWNEDRFTRIHLNGKCVNSIRGDGAMSNVMKAAAQASSDGVPQTFSNRRDFDAFFVGCNGGANRTGGNMAGAMDELRLYGEPLSDEAVAALFADGRAVSGLDTASSSRPDYAARYATDPPNPYEGAPLPATAPGLFDPADLELVDAVAFDRIPADASRFSSVGECRIGRVLQGAAPSVPYLEASPALNARFAYRFSLDASSPLYLFEIDYPDDALRTMDIIAQGCGQTAWDGNTGASYALQAGLACGGEYPNTGRILTHRCLFWRGEDRDVALAAMTARGGAPAAISAIRLYRVRSGSLPAMRVAEPPANADGWRRTFALYFEDPAIGYDFGVNGTDEYKIGEMIDRTAATMKFTGQDMLVYPGAWYAGIIDGETYNPRNHAQAYREAWLAKFDREGLGIMPTINQNDILLPPESITYAKIENGSLHDSPYSIFDDGKPNPGGWHGTPPNFNVAHPAVQAALEKAVDTFIAEGRAHPSFKGVVLHLTRHSLAWFGDERAGYNDYCVAAFCRETGNVLPASLNCADPMRGQAYAEWLRADPARWKAWLDWRCRVVADLYRRLATKLRAARPDLKLMVNNFLLPDWKHPDFGSENFIPEAARRAGLDPRLLSNVPNLIVCQTEIPADYRFFGPKDPADPKDNGRFGLVRATAEPAQRELYSKCGDWTFLSGASYPWANQHDRYWESAVGNPARNGGAPTLSCDWLKECTWRVTTINPSGRSALRHYALPFRHHDVLGLSKGGFLVGTYGTEEVLLPFIRAFRALPAVVFDDLSAQGDVRIRTARFKDRDWFYAINTGETEAEALLDLPAGTRDLVSGEEMVPHGVIRLAPYELRSFAVSSLRVLPPLLTNPPPIQEPKP